MFKAIDSFKSPPNARRYDTAAVMIARAIAAHNRYISRCLEDAENYNRVHINCGKEYYKKKMLENCHLAALAYDNSIELYKSWLILQRGSQPEAVIITETTAIKLFTGFYVLIKDYCNPISNFSDSDTAALMDIWVNLSDAGKKELMEWAHKFSIDKTFNDLVKVMEGEMSK